jgi:hypothetical protein
MTNLIKLPSGDYINLANVERVRFHDDENFSQIYFLGDVVALKEDDAIFIKQFLDRNYGEFFLMHSEDYAAQILGLGYALEKLEKLSGESAESLTQDIILKANERLSKLSKKSIGLMIKHYQERVGGETGGNLVNVKIPA